ncbi:DNA helicase-2/ATP-dependent DNA helicase PcrA [Nocardioides daedukensis]|uniref:DNA 3'-5' helicase n=1 Tax=Nocardioides daedukensis TaxID=634462 RepID=A0A7Y9S6V4_9ACTN|nr:ATP-dependent DNA helicase UvrD2 [Nocardioides daedukensis]NYG60500.1 DNA helicase-2/ATP-dependent DNA helicase PcrA [Nocardioides daedukensis]
MPADLPDLHRGGDDLLSALDPEQRRVAEALRGPVRVLAGAGTGKTRAITHRIAHGVATGVYQPTEVLAVTFTTKAAGEMRTRLRQLGAPGVQARTFHAAALRQLRYFWPTVHGSELPQLTESKLPLIGLAVSRQRLRADKGTMRDLASEIEWAKVSNVRPEEYATLAPARNREVSGLDHATVARVFSAYEDAKRSQGRMDMEDVLLLNAALLAEDERVAAQVRRQYKFFVVDEFQDVSPLQSALLDLWLGGRDEICVVGDPAQTIYSFAGANADYLRKFTAKHPGATSIELVRNYRSTPEVIGAANHLLAGTSSRGVELRAQRPSGDKVEFVEHADEVAEAEAVAARIKQIHAAGTPLSEIAVLFRINAQSEAFEDALSARGIAYVVRGAARFFDRQEVRQAITLLRGTARSSGGTDSMVEDVRGTLSGMGWNAEPPTGRGTARDRWESLQALVSQAETFAATSQGAADGALGAFVDDLDRRAAEQHAPVAEGVTLATLHTAKGLEWDAVFVCGVQEGSIPISFAQTPAEVEEERRLLYVGVTRARLQLSVSWSLARNPGGRSTRRASRFLHGLRPENSTGQAGSARKPKKAARAAMCGTCGKPLSSAAERKVGRCGDCPATYDEALFERLRQWRKERASDDGVPAYVIFTDKTLEAIAEARPDNEAKLLRISGVGPAKIERYGEAVLELIE